MIEKENYDYWEEDSKIDHIVDKQQILIQEIKDLMKQKEYDKSIEKIENLEEIINSLKTECNELNELAEDSTSELYNLQEELDGGYADYVVGNYEELKKQMARAGLWKDDMDYFFENLIRYSNKL